jgi:hypothetical protein
LYKEEANPTNFNYFLLVYLLLLLLTFTKELNKRDRAAHERIFKTKTRPLPFFLLSQNTLIELKAKRNQTLPVRMN